MSEQEYDAIQNNVRPAELSCKILMGNLPLPCWIKIGRSRHRITEENHKDVARGLLMAVELDEENQ